MQVGKRMREAMELLSDGKFRRHSELVREGIDPKVIRRLKKANLVQVTESGFYTLTDIDETQEFDFVKDGYAEILKKAGEDAALCLYTAAAWHGFSIDQPVETWIGHSWEKGKIAFPYSQPVKAVRWRNKLSIETGIEVSEEYKGVPIKVTSPERTVVDMIRYSPLVKTRKNANLMIDEESALEALNNYCESEHWNPSNLSEMAYTFGIEDVLSPLIKNAERTRLGGQRDFDEHEDEYIGMRNR